MAWEAHAGATTDDFPENLAPSGGGGVSLTALHPVVCPAGEVTLSHRPEEGFEGGWTVLTSRVGVGLGRRTGEGAVGFALYGYPHFLWTRRTDGATPSRYHWGAELGGGLSGTNAWIGAGVRIISEIGSESTENLPGAAVLLRGGVIF